MPSRGDLETPRGSGYVPRKLRRRARVVRQVDGVCLHDADGKRKGLPLVASSGVWLQRGSMYKKRGRFWEPFAMPRHWGGERV